MAFLCVTNCVSGLIVSFAAYFKLNMDGEAISFFKEAKQTTESAHFSLYFYVVFLSLGFYTKY